MEEGKGGQRTFQPMLEIESLTAPSDHTAAVEKDHSWDLA